MKGASDGRSTVAAGQLEKEAPMEMLYGAIDIHKHVFQAAVFDAASGEVVEARFPATRERLGDWATEWQGRLSAVAIEATSGWRRVVGGLRRHGVVVVLADPGEAVAQKGKGRLAKTDRLGACAFFCVSVGG